MKIEEDKIYDETKIEEVYELGEEENNDESIYTKITNAYMIYYKKLYNRPPDMKMFDGINYEDETSTNGCLESYYEYIIKSNENNKLGDEYVDIYKYDEDNKETFKKFEELYGLSIDGKIKFVSPDLITLLGGLTTKEDWELTDWMIIPLKKID